MDYKESGILHQQFQEHPLVKRFGGVLGNDCASSETVNALIMDQYKVKLYTKGTDRNSRWYVSFYAIDARDNVRKRHRVYIPPNENTIQRKQSALAWKEDVLQFLRQNKGVVHRNKAISGTFSHDSPKTLGDALKTALRMKSDSVSAKTMSSYTGKAKVMTEWAVQKDLINTPLNKIDRGIVNRFLSDLKSQGITNCTRNNYSRALHALFEALVEQGYMENNPFKYVKPLKMTTEAYMPYYPDQINTIKGYLMANDPQLWHFCLFMYYFLMRPVEIVQLKREHVNLQQRRIHIDSLTHKSRKGHYATISESGLEFLLESRLVEGKVNGFIFDEGNSKSPNSRVNRFGERHRKMLNHLNKKEGMPLYKNQSLYSWKSTGAANLYMATKDIRLVQMQIGHADITTTELYLKNIGVLEDHLNKTLVRSQPAI